jgi:hypothetical protein
VRIVGAVRERTGAVSPFVASHSFTVSTRELDHRGPVEPLVRSRIGRGLRQIIDVVPAPRTEPTPHPSSGGTPL